ncbi:BspA family leucine-rich repeat surface protein [Mycoplasma yeatsii]|uniref:BspA family leucine-rich repeat surface protein n=1 Tax=Mycoplasma yeatsii TaxID=51365 RepID=UPI0005B23E71|nr:BspA family leucine-rich repeat surface protein [Mycoplasma yeatsii]AJM71746.1 PARCEL domain-containing protein [Mycoplasma yeatsii GM274B]
MKKKLLWIIAPILILLALIGTGIGVAVAKKPNSNTQNKTDEENKNPNQDNENQKINLSDLTKKVLGTIEEQNLNKKTILNKLKELNVEIKDRDLSSLSVEISEFSAVIKSTTKDLKFSGEVEVRFIPVDGNGSNNRRTAVYNEDKSICKKIGYSINQDGNWMVKQFDINTSKVPEELPWFITSLVGLFSENKNERIEGIEKWDTSNITVMSFMFERALSFNQPLNDWNTSNVTNMFAMFSGAKSFNQPLNNWNTSKVTNMRLMFDGAKSFNQDISNWDTSNVTDMTAMFQKAPSFNQDISNWNVDNVTEFEDFSHDFPESNHPEWTESKRPTFKIKN